MALIGELTFYWLVSGTMVLLTALAVVLAVGSSPSNRRSLLVLPAIPAVLILSYAGMAMEFLTFTDAEGEPITTARFLGYFFTYPVVVLFLGWLVDAPRRSTLTGFGLVVVFIIAALGNWFLEGVAGVLAQIVVVTSLLTLLWVLFRPLTRAARSVGGSRELAYGKTRNLLTAVWLFYLIVAITSRQGFGLLDDFGGVFIGAYLDIAGHVGAVIILLRSTDALEERFDDPPSFWSYLSP